MKWWKDQMDTQARVGPVLRQLREEYKLTQATIASFIGCSGASISLLENGKFGSLKLVEAYAWALGLELSDLRIQSPGVTFIKSERIRRSLKAAPPRRKKPAKYFTMRVA